jgi:hypothetical protein
MSEFIPNRPSATVWAGDAPEDTPEAAPAEAPQLRRVQGRRAGMTVEMVDGVAEVVREGDSMFGSVPAKEPTTTWSREPLKFYAAGTSSPILARDVRPDTVVDLGGKIGEVSVGCALVNNWLTDTGNGFERAGEAKAPAAPRRVATKAPVDDADDTGEDTASDTSEARNKSADQAPAAPERSYLAHHEEAALVEVERAIGEQTFSALETTLTDNLGDPDSIPESFLTSVGRALGVDREGARQAIAAHAAPLTLQARNSIEQMTGPETADEVFDWARSDKSGRELLQASIRGQLNERSLSGYRALVAGFLSHQARTDPERVAAGVRAGGTKATVKSGKVIVTLPDGTEGEFTSLVRGGVLRLVR